MKNTKSQTFRLVEDVLLPDYNAAEAGINRFLGREQRHPWQLTNQDFTLTLPLRVEYRQALQEGIIQQTNKE